MRELKPGMQKLVAFLLSVALFITALCRQINAVDYEVEETVKALWHNAPVAAVTVPLLMDAPKIDGVLDDVWFNRNGAAWNLTFLHEEQKKSKPLYSRRMSGNMKAEVLNWTRT